MKFLRIFHSLDPKVGGPVEASKQNSAVLVESGHQVTFLTLDPQDSPFLQDIPFPTIALGARSSRYGYTPKMVPWLKKHATQFDIILVQGIWLYQSWGTHQGLKKLPTPYFVFTHGMLDPWFHIGNTSKYIKKCIYWFLRERKSLHSAKAVLFTTQTEMSVSKTSMPLSSFNGMVVPYGIREPNDPTTVPPLNNWFPKLDLIGKRPLLFMSRIHPKKGCDDLIKAIAKVYPDHPELHLFIAGPDQDHWMEELQTLSKDLKVEDAITWVGMASGEKKLSLLHHCEAFILPSHQENFGIAVAEALARGLPALISNKVNTHLEIDECQAGWVSDDTPEGCESNLRNWLETTSQTIANYSYRSKRCFDEHFNLDKTINRFVETLKSQL